MSLEQLKNDPKLTISERQDFLSDYFLNHTRPMTWLNQFGGVFRSRNLGKNKSQEINSIQEIWYRDQTTLKASEQTQGRCHGYGQNFFYASNSVETTIKEIRPLNGQYILIGEFKLKIGARIPECQFAGIEMIKKYEDYRELLSSFKYQSESDKLKEEFIAECFHTVVNKDNDFLYKNTIAITNILLNNKSSDCLVYPSVGSKLSLLNYGFKSGYVDHNLLCSKIWIYQTEISKRYIQLHPVKFGVIAQNWQSPKDSKIQWRDVPNNKIEIIKYSL